MAAGGSSLPYPGRPSRDGTQQGVEVVPSRRGQGGPAGYFECPPKVTVFYSKKRGFTTTQTYYSYDSKRLTTGAARRQCWLSVKPINLAVWRGNRGKA